MAFVNSQTGETISSNQVACGSFNATAGNLIAVLVGTYDVSKTVTSVTDTAGNTYVKAHEKKFQGSLELWYAKNITGHASNIVTATLDSAPSSARMIVHQYSGRHTTAPLGVTADATVASGTSITSSSFSPAASGDDVVVGVHTVGGQGTFTAGTNYTLRALAGSPMQSEDRVNAPSGAQTAGMTWGNSAAADMVVTTFKVADSIIPISGSPSATFNPQGAPSFLQAITGSPQVQFTPFGPLSLLQALSGSPSIDFSPSGQFGDSIPLAGGQTDIKFTCSGNPLLGTTQPDYIWGVLGSNMRRWWGLISLGIRQLNRPVPKTGVATLRLSPSGSLTVIHPFQEQSGNVEVRLSLTGAPSIASVQQIAGAPGIFISSSASLSVTGAGGGLTIGDYDLFSDTLNRYPPPALSLPSYNIGAPLNTSVIDPVFGTRLIRVSGTSGQAVGSTGATWRDQCGPDYPKTAAWNADSSRLFMFRGVLIGSSSSFLYMDGSTYVPLYARPWVKGQYRWHPTDSRYMIWIHYDGTVGRFDPDNNIHTTLFNPGAGYSNCTFFGEGNPSNDGNIVCVCGTKNGIPVVFAVNIQTGVRFPDIFPTQSPYNFSGLDWGTMSPHGDYIIISQGSSLQRLLTLNGSIVGSWTGMGHFDFGWTTGLDQAAICWGQAEYVRIPDLVRAGLPWPGTNQYHTSARNNQEKGWCYGFPDDMTGVYDGELVAGEIASGSGRVRRICHHRGFVPGSGVMAYDHLPMAVPSPEGLRVFFSTDWGNASGPVYAFVVDVREVPLLEGIVQFGFQSDRGPSTIIDLGGGWYRTNTETFRAYIANWNLKGLLKFIWNGLTPINSGLGTEDVTIRIGPNDMNNLDIGLWFTGFNGSPNPYIVIQQKYNPEDYGNSWWQPPADGIWNKGYTFIGSSALGAIQQGQQYKFSYLITGNQLVVKLNGAQVWSGTIPQTSVDFLMGPSLNVRTDNAKVDFQLSLG